MIAICFDPKFTRRVKELSRIVIALEDALVAIYARGEKPAPELTARYDRACTLFEGMSATARRRKVLRCG